MNNIYVFQYLFQMYFVNTTCKFITMQAQVLLLPFQCMGHTSCSKLYRQRLHSTSQQSSHTSVNVKLEPEAEHVTEVHLNRDIGEGSPGSDATGLEKAGSRASKTFTAWDVTRMKGKPDEDIERNDSYVYTMYSDNSMDENLDVSIETVKYETDLLSDADRISCQLGENEVPSEPDHKVGKAVLSNHIAIHNIKICEEVTAQVHDKLELFENSHAGDESPTFNQTTCTVKQTAASNRKQEAVICTSGIKPCKSHKSTHTNQTLYICPTCGKSFNDMGACKRHEQIHTGEKPHICHTCGKSFMRLGDCKRHQRVHTGEKPYKCPTCDKSFSDSGHCKTHQRIHTGEKPYLCFTCGKSFSDPGACKTHERIHTGEKPYPCPTCGKSFIKSSDLMRHQHTHTGEKPYICPLCDKAFSDIGTCKSHQRIHTGEKPYKCPICDKSFTQSASCRKHQRTHTGLEIQ